MKQPHTSGFQANSERFSGVEAVGVASTQYPDLSDPRFELALNNAENWNSQGLPYVVVDSTPEANGIAKKVKDAHEARGAVVVRATHPGIASQRIQAIDFAFQYGADKVVSHEPEKIEMAKYAAEISSALDQHEIVVIGRTALALDSLPTEQRRTEVMAGWILEQTHHLPHDTLSGGRGFTRLGANELAKYPATDPSFNNWIYLYKTPLDARDSGLSVGGVDVDLLHPVIQTEQEQDNPTFDRKRYDQFKLQLDYLLSRADVDQAALAVVIAVKSALSGITKDTTNEAFSESLARLESRLAAFGYQKPNTL